MALFRLQSVAQLIGGRMTLADIEIAEGVVAIRRGEDEPRVGGGTRYQEMCRSALLRLIERGLVARVEPTDRRGLMRFRRVC
jgi:hypothetical protein